MSWSTYLALSDYGVGVVSGVPVAGNVGGGVGDGPKVGVSRRMGTRRICPGKIAFGSSRSLAAMMASMVVKNFSALIRIESPGKTKYSIIAPRPRLGGRGDGVGNSISGFGIRSSSPTLRDRADSLVNPFSTMIIR